jgi:GT2 family glycosyltransferase
MAGLLETFHKRCDNAGLWHTILVEEKEVRRPLLACPTGGEIISRSDATAAPGKMVSLYDKPAAGEIVPVDFLISSGSLISLAALADIGPFDEGLFIEHVDTDWALRAGAKGYRLYGVHALGDAALSASPLGLRRRRFFLYKPERNYYLLRNSVALWRRHYTPWHWIIHDVRRTFLLMLFYALFVPPRLARLRLMLRAVRDGLGMK